MSFEGTFGSFDFYHATVRLGTERVGYSFRVQFHDGAIRGYDRSGLFFEKGQDHSQRRFFLTPGLSTPDWAKGAVMYQILVDRFCNGDPSSDVLSDEYAYGGRHVRRVDDWNRVPEPLSDFNEFYGGDLQGVPSISIRSLFHLPAINMTFRTMITLTRILAGSFPIGASS